MIRRIITVLCCLALIAAVGFALSQYERAQKNEVQNDNSGTTASLVGNPVKQSLKPELKPHYQLPESGRMTIEHSELPEGGEVTLALPLAANSMGDTPLPVRVVSVDGRVVDVVATQAFDDQPSVTVSLDPKWLTKGSYMIQLKTKEKSALALRRYVLIVN